MAINDVSNCEKLSPIDFYVFFPDSAPEPHILDSAMISIVSVPYPSLGYLH